MKINKEKTIAVVIDLQEKLIPHIYNKDIIINNNIKLLQCLEILDVPVLFTQQYTKGLGNTIPEISKFITKNEDIIEKISFSCCKENKFLDKILPLNPEFAIITGIESHICILQTAIDLLQYNIIPVVVTNCVSSRHEYDHQIALTRLNKEGAILTTYESLLFELMEYAGNETFKKVSNILKE